MNRNVPEMEASLGRISNNFINLKTALKEVLGDGFDLMMFKDFMVAMNKARTHLAEMSADTKLLLEIANRFKTAAAEVKDIEQEFEALRGTVKNR